MEYFLTYASNPHYRVTYQLLELFLMEFNGWILSSNGCLGWLRWLKSFITSLYHCLTLSSVFLFFPLLSFNQGFYLLSSSSSSSSLFSFLFFLSLASRCLIKVPPLIFVSYLPSSSSSSLPLSSSLLWLSIHNLINQI